MQKSSYQYIWIVAPVMAAALLLVWFFKPQAPSTAAAPALPNTTAVPIISNTKVRDVFEQALKQTTTDQQTVKSLHASILSASKPEAVALIREFLATGKDRSTGMEFEVENGGSLKSWPTLRTMLLDLVAGIDPAAAADIAREILANPTTADEWALALRNLGRIERSPETDALLLSKTVELIANPGWQSAPSVGYLNAFDLFVHLEVTTQTPLLSGLVQNKDRKDLAHAAFLTIDRLVQRQPVEMLRKLAADTALQQSRPEMAAQQFARADLRDATQREIVKNWLLDPARTPTQLRSFTGVFPNQNHFVSHNLLTREEPPSGDQLAAHDHEALQILNSWRADPSFEPISEHLAAMTARLEQFTRSTIVPEP